jgi:hypothetical protein
VQSPRRLSAFMPRQRRVDASRFRGMGPNCRVTTTPQVRKRRRQDRHARRIEILETLARPEGFEPPTFGFEGRRSIQLSYRRVPEREVARAMREGLPLRIRTELHGVRLCGRSAVRSTSTAPCAARSPPATFGFEGRRSIQLSDRRVTFAGVARVTRRGPPLRIRTELHGGRL